AFGAVIGTQACLSGIANFPALLPVDTLRTSSETAWSIHSWLASLKRPVLVYLPDNRYAGGTVEEALLKGMSDLPTWNITTGQTLLDTLAPGYSFHQQLLEIPADAAVMWLDIPGESPLSDRTPALESMRR